MALHSLASPRSRRGARVCLATGVVAVISAVALGACSDGARKSVVPPSATQSLSPAPSGADPSAAESVSTSTTTNSVMTVAASGQGPLELTATAPDGASFTLGDHAGRTVFVETFATWCPNCRGQLAETQAVAAAANDVVFLALSVESNLDPSALATYADDNAFSDIVFGVLDDASLVALESRYNSSVLVPSVTPKFVVSPDGVVGDLVLGSESSEQIRARLTP